MATNGLNMPDTVPQKRFQDAVDQHLQQSNESSCTLQLGENGTLEYTNQGVGSDILAISQMVRGGDSSELVDDILATGTTSGVADLFVLLFVTRNCRGGKGEKKLAYDMFLRVWKVYPETAKKLLSLFSHYGYYKDLIQLSVAAKSEPQCYDLIHTAITLMQDQLVKDLASLETYKKALKEAVDEDAINELKKSGPGISLLAKWLPRERTSFDKKLDFVHRFTASDGYSTRKEEWCSRAKARYRRDVSELTGYLALPEVLLAAQKEDEIRFGMVASRATMRLRKVFLNENKNGELRSTNPKRIRLAERFGDHVIKNGMKGGQLMPHEIVKTILENSSMSKDMELLMDAQWKDLWANVQEQAKTMASGDGAEFSPARMVPLCDVSSSMYGVPMHVAIALSIGISEMTHDAFKGMILTFESTPQWHRLDSSDTIVKKVRSLAEAPWGGSTNFERALDLILNVSENAGLAREDIPSLIVFSDMQFDEAGGFYHSRDTSSVTMHETIRSKFQVLASRLGWTDSDPTPMVYWNLRNTGGHPVEKDTEGTVMLAGFSPSLLKMVMYGEALREEEVVVVQQDGSTVIEKVRATPAAILRKMLDDTLYDPVRAILAESQEHKLQQYDYAIKMTEDKEFEMV